MSCRYGKINLFCNFVKSVVVEWCNCLETCSDVACEYEVGLVNPVFFLILCGSCPSCAASVLAMHQAVELSYNGANYI